MAFAATRFGFQPCFFGDIGVVVGPSSTNCDGASLFFGVFGVGAFFCLVCVFVFSDGANASMAPDLLFLVGGIGGVEV